MLSGLTSAAAGMAAQQQRIDAVANDLANASTTGYKRVRVAFRDLAYQAAGEGAAPTVRTGAGSAAELLGRSFEAGAIRQTGRALDVALQGPGFLRVRLADGREGLTRDGNLQVDGAGRLVTAHGGTLLPPVQLPAGTAEDAVEIAADGTVRAGGRVAGRLALVVVRSPQGLAAAGDNAFVATPESGPALAAGTGTTLAGGALEASNVEMADAMVSMIEAQRAFELASKAIATADQMLAVANEVKR